MRAWGLWMVAVVGCSIPEEDFADTYAVTVCDRLEECDRGDFENQFDDREECWDDLADVAEFFMDAADLLGGVYSEDAARECIDSIQSAECGDFSSGEYACDVYD